jgi:type VI secretion system secreted protein Hcp
MSNSATAPGQPRQLKLDSVAVRKRIDKSSPILMLKCCTGEHLPEAVFEYQKTLPTGQDAVYLKIKLSDVLVSGYSLSGGGGGGTSLPVDTLSINFTKIEMTYIPYDDAGSPLQPVTAQCDFTQNQ